MSKNTIIILAILIFGIISGIFFSGIFIIPLLILPAWILLKISKDVESIIWEIATYSLCFFTMADVFNFGIAVIFFYIFTFYQIFKNFKNV